mgnify:CR=1 FL=1
MKNILLLSCLMLTASLFPAHRILALERCDSQACAEQAQIYLEQLDAFAFDRVWQAFTPLYQSLYDPQAWQRQQKALRKAYGPLVVRNLARVTCRETFYHAPDGKYCLVQFTTSFVNKQHAVETVVLDGLVPGLWPIAELRAN